MLKALPPEYNALQKITKDDMQHAEIKSKIHLFHSEAQNTQNCMQRTDTTYQPHKRQSKRNHVQCKRRKKNYKRR